MAIAIIMDFDGGTIDQYNRTLELMGMDPDGHGPPGAIFHWVAKTDDGLRVVDVWESREVFDRFAQEEIGPKTQQAGIPAPPRMEFFEVHNTLRGPNA